MGSPYLSVNYDRIAVVGTLQLIEVRTVVTGNENLCSYKKALSNICFVGDRKQRGLAAFLTQWWSHRIASGTVLTLPR